MTQISINSQNLALAELQKSIKNKDKLVLLLGKTGLGKSFLLENLWDIEFKKARARQSLFSESDLQNEAKFDNNPNLNLNQNLTLNLNDKSNLDLNLNSKKNDLSLNLDLNLEQSQNLNENSNPNLKQKIFLFSKPFFDENAFVSEIFDSISKQKSQDFTSNYPKPKSQNFELLHDKFKQNADTSYIFLLDEVGMYDESLLEKVRILSDLPNISFVLALHKKQGILQKEHFKSRIFKEIWLKTLSVPELDGYARGKFALVLKNRHLKRVLKVSGSNLRLIDKVFSTYNVLNAFYAKNNKSKSSKTMLEMSFFHHGLLK